MIVQHIINYFFFLSYFFYLYFPFSYPLLLNILQKNYMLFYASCKVMFYNKNLLHSEILAFKNQIYQIPTHYIFHSRYLIIQIFNK